MAQVAKRDVCIPQDGRVVEAVCMECTNFGEEYEVSPQGQGGQGGGGEVKAGAGGDEHESLPAPRPSVARTRPSAPTARPPALTARPSAPAGGSRGRRGRALQEGRHRGGKLLRREDRPVAGQPPRSGGSSGAGQITAKETQPDACAGARARACVGACARACVERALERAPESAPERAPGTSRACPLPWPRKLLTTWV